MTNHILGIIGPLMLGWAARGLVEAWIRRQRFLRQQKVERLLPPPEGLYPRIEREQQAGPVRDKHADELTTEVRKEEKKRWRA